MKIAVLFGAWSLSFRKSITFDNLWTDPRGLTGSELAFVRTAEELHKLGHEVHVYTVSADKEWRGLTVHPVDEISTIDDSFDAAISINEPDLLRPVRARLRVCEQFLNDVTYCKVGFDQHVDLWTSPSIGHLEQVLHNPAWRRVEVLPDYPNGKATYEPDASKWIVNPLGCDPWRYAAPEYCDTCYSKQGGLMPTDETGKTWRCGCGQIAARSRTESFRLDPPRKVPGRVIHSSSPDRGLHWLLQEWPKVIRAIPHANLRIFYRLEPWLRHFDGIEYFPPVEPLRARALFIEESLRRFRELGGLNVTIRDSVSRTDIEREQAEAEVMAYPADTTAWSEGFSCSTLEGCAARACPIITDCDAFPTIYGGVLPMAKRGDWSAWSDMVIRALTDKQWRDEVNGRAYEFAHEHTWKRHAARLERAILDRLSPPEKTEEQIMSEIRIEGRP